MVEKKTGDGARERPVSLAPLKLKEALAGLFAVPNPEATKPKNKKKARPNGNK